MDVTRSHSLSIGIVGLPNSGKSTLFNALTKNSIPAENYPFCTIDKNVGVVEMFDERLKNLSVFYNSKKVVYGAIKFVDIAGLVKGASQGEGLGNKFLSHIREVDVLLYVLRAFESENIVHVYNRVNPMEDFEIVQSELIFKDIEVLDRFIREKERMKEKGIDVFKTVRDFLNRGVPVVDMDLSDEDLDLLKPFSLLTQKKRMFLLNVNDEKFDGFNDDEFVLNMDVKLIGELGDMEDVERGEYIDMLGGDIVGVDELISLAIKRLNLISFYTGNEKECNAWSIVSGSTVKEAAGVIHSDLSSNFITADVINVEKLMEVGGWVNAKELGLVKNYGKDYIVEDGDYIVILANI